MYQLNRILILILIASACIAGCSTIRENGSAMADNSGNSARQPGQMILVPDDLPAGFTVIESRAKNETEMSTLARDLGWKDGYVVRYEKAEGLFSEPTVISQNIAIYPAERMPEIVRFVAEAEKSQQQYRVAKLKDPNIGENSRASAVYSAPQQDVTMPGVILPDTGGRVSNGSSLLPDQQKPLYFEIIFSKGNVFEVIRISGPSEDYETLLNLARIANGRI